MSERRYPLQPLCDALACSPDDLKRRLGLDRRQVALYLARGLTEARADQLAVKAGLPTHLVWPAMLNHAIEDATRECAERSCSQRFLPTRRTHRYCSHRCRERERMRRKYQSDPAFVAEKLEQRRAYYRECAEYEKAEARRRYWENPERYREARRSRHQAAKAA